ncbi:hypothetical protein K435DRAFT_784973 [Dendrothele bispora CBS 962.96]|uniref:Methyltransferase n=1 Tax=Dendrothele bispora (strain CBS 962.96) TaxID=1314807 RepID=A0A4S8L028_DENBC|nr:hypothetical protein K435DRAFT_784973 [Dendrothele bispora CBS 962.96]
MPGEPTKTQQSSEPQSATASLMYFTPPPDGSRPYTRVVHSDTDTHPPQNWSSTPHVVQIQNLRGGREHLASLDSTGFQFYSHKSGMKYEGFDSEEEIKEKYYPETEELIKKLTGATRVVLFDHTIRRHRPGQKDTVQARQPVSRVHVDQTPKSAAARVHRHVPSPDLASQLLQRRFQILNLWRPLGHPALSWPLALCDYRSVDTERDLAAVRRIAMDGTEGETFAVKFSEKHEWMYLRGMTEEEVVLIKCYDSLDDKNISVYTPHTAFEDPTTPEGSPPRESIELRALVFYD